jgi:hypothetical protein
MFKKPIYLTKIPKKVKKGKDKQFHIYINKNKLPFFTYDVILGLKWNS